ncbi:transcription termination/antitermination protein NusG [Novosphingobium sp. JCM 18896]|uniref:transcription termination/antitermination protein NusG n=1 Tax=Novosphingobium sp. JCM 18896 TaxID=2989731 RepID=UPI002222F176|nr:hypothetical protein [Novosphingobium sp. JCM 18896]MCW1431384.1 hypothetical protein [Novosphingobium sp. JCM 18896]
MTDWVILRCAGQSTLRLAESLTEDGYEAWSPRVARHWREGESRTRKTEIVPGTPCYVFARSDRLVDLLALARSPSLGYMKWDPERRRHVSRGHPRFSVMPDSDGYASVTDRELRYLKTAERKDRPKELVRPFLTGEEVKVIDGPYQGLSGTVIRAYGVHVQIEFPRSTLSHKLPMWMLQHAEELEKAA